MLSLDASFLWSCLLCVYNALLNLWPQHPAASGISIVEYSLLLRHKYCEQWPRNFCFAVIEIGNWFKFFLWEQSKLFDFTLTSVLENKRFLLSIMSQRMSKNTRSFQSVCKQFARYFHFYATNNQLPPSCFKSEAGLSVFCKILFYIYICRMRCLFNKTFIFGV